MSDLTVSLFLFLILIQYSTPSYAQDTGEKEYPFLGIKFTIPNGWKGQEMEEGYIIGSDTEAGFIMLITHESNNLEELKEEAKQGIYEPGGTQLQLAGDLVPVGNEGVGAKFIGTLEYNKAEAYIAAIINPFGLGLTIIAITDPQNYSKQYEQLAKDLAMGVKFAKPKEPPILKEWKEALKGAELTYLSSSGGSDYSGYSGSSSHSEILLCPNGQFSYFNNSSASFDIDAGFGSANSNDQGRGTWSIENDGDGKNAILDLKFSDGRNNSYQLDYREDKTYLNDYRYFRIYDHNRCN